MKDTVKIHAEQSVLGSILRKNNLYESSASKLSSEHFFDTDHKKIYMVIKNLIDSGKAADFITVNTELESMLGDNLRQLDIYVMELVRSATGLENFDAYVDLVIESYLCRRVVDLGSQVALSGQSNDGAIGVIDKFSADLQSLRAEGGRDRSVNDIGEILQFTMDGIQKRFENGGILPGISTGFVGLDKILDGFQRQDLFVLAGRPGMGKTSLALAISKNVAAAGKQVLFFSMEMASEKIGIKLLSTVSGVESNKLTSGRMTDSELERCSEAVAVLNSGKLRVDDTSNATVMEIKNECRNALHDLGSLDVVVIDHLGWISSSSKHDNKNNEISEITRGLKEIAREMNCTILLLSQLNRGVEGRADKMPSLADLRDSGSIEQDADVVAFVYREDYYNLNGPKNGKVEVIIAKHRMGELGIVPIKFNEKTTSFYDDKHII